MLHTLILDGALPFIATDDDADDDAYPNIVLPKLSRLELKSRIRSCTKFLEHINFPVTADTTVTCDLILSYHRFCHFLSVIGNRMTNFVISALTFQVPYGRHPRPRTVRILCTITHSHQPAPTNVTLEFDTEHFNVDDFIDTASETLPMTNVHELDIVGFRRSLAISFDSLPDIHTIRFKHCYPALRLVRDGLADTHRLRNLQFFEVEFNGVIPTLMDGLERRLLSGIPIEYIRLDTCYDLRKADVMRMKEFVQDVEWDGKEML